MRSPADNKTENTQPYCLTCIPYCSLETNLVNFSAASLKLSAHTLAHNYSETNVNSSRRADGSDAYFLK